MVSQVANTSDLQMMVMRRRRRRRTGVFTATSPLFEKKISLSFFLFCFSPFLGIPSLHLFLPAPPPTLHIQILPLLRINF